MSYCCIDIPAGVRVAYKIFPGDEFCLELASKGQSDADWSALYGQFSLSHTIAYLPNHFDRGCTTASLVSICTKRNIRCFAYFDNRYGNTNISSAVKADLLRQCISANVSGPSLCSDKPLLQSIGEDLNMFVAILDADEIECAIPHCMMNHDNFTYSTLTTFHVGSGSALVSSAYLLNKETGEKESIQLSKAEKGDMALLSNRIESITGCSNCAWLDREALLRS